MSAEANYSGEDMQEAAAPTTEVSSEEHNEQEQQQEQNVPLSALQSERSQRQQLAEELQMMKDHIALMQTQSKQPVQQEPAYDKDDIPTWGDVESFVEKREQQYQSKLNEMQMAQKHPDYAEVISEYLPDVIKQNPALRKSLEKTQDYDLAYYLAKNSNRYLSENKKTRKNADAERILQNSQQAGSLSSTGTVSPINAAKRYRDMGDDDFRKEVNKNMGYF